MFQSFDDVSEKHLSAARVAQLREELARRGLDGFIIPRQDEFQGEYVAPYAERLRWLTGFAGSWGMAILMKDRGAIFVDGRYTIQVKQQVDTGLFTPKHLVDEPPSEWMEKELRVGRSPGLRPLAADRRSGGEIREGLRQGGRQARSRHRQSDRCGLARSSRPARWHGRRTADAIFREEFRG